MNCSLKKSTQYCYMIMQFPLVCSFNKVLPVAARSNSSDSIDLLIKSQKEEAYFPKCFFKHHSFSLHLITIMHKIQDLKGQTSSV